MINDFYISNRNNIVVTHTGIKMFAVSSGQLK